MIAAVVAAALALAAPPVTVRPTAFPAGAEAGKPWSTSFRVARGGKPFTGPVTVTARGAQALTARAVRTGRGRYRATFTFRREGRWNVSARVGTRNYPLGLVISDVAPDPLFHDPLAVAADDDGSLLVGQLREGALLRLRGGRASAVAAGVGTFHIAVAAGRIYAAGRDGAVYRVDGSTFTRLTAPIDASSVAVDAAGNLYVTVYVGYVKKVAPDGTITTVAGDGTEGSSGDGGPATAAKIFHPHQIVHHDGVLYVADTENRRIRRIDLATGTITTFGGDVGITVALAVGPDGSIYSGDVARNAARGGVTRTTPDGRTTRLYDHSVTGVTVARDGTVYAAVLDDNRVVRFAGGRWETVARGS